MNTNHAALYDLLIESCRHAPDIEQLEMHAAQINDWAGFLDSAYTHGVFPLVHKSLKSITAVPENIKLRLKSTNFEIARRNMTMTAELLKIMKLLEENGIPALAIKGPVLSQMIHGDVTQRQYADLDILVQQEDMWSIGQLLTQNEYMFDHPLKFIKNKTLLKIAKDITFSNEKHSVHIEVHWRLFSGKLFTKSNLKLFHEHPVACNINKSPIPTLDTDILLLYLLLHGSKHLWERIEWIVDVDRLIRDNRDIDWARICKAAEIMEIEPMFYLGLSVTKSIFDTLLPVEIHLYIEKHTEIVNAKNQLLEQIEANAILNETQLFLHDLSDIGLVKKDKSALVYLKKWFRLTTNEVFVIDFPTVLSPLYYVIVGYSQVRNRLVRIKDQQKEDHDDA